MSTFVTWLVSLVATIAVAIVRKLNIILLPDWTIVPFALLSLILFFVLIGTLDCRVQELYGCSKGPSEIYVVSVVATVLSLALILAAISTQIQILPTIALIALFITFAIYCGLFYSLSSDVSDLVRKKQEEEERKRRKREQYY